jgi:hypothetical protein
MPGYRLRRVINIFNDTVIGDIRFRSYITGNPPTNPHPGVAGKNNVIISQFKSKCNANNGCGRA